MTTDRLDRFYRLMGEDPPQSGQVLHSEKEGKQVPGPADTGESLSLHNQSDPSSTLPNDYEAAEAWESLTSVERFLQNISVPQPGEPQEPTVEDAIRAPSKKPQKSDEPLRRHPDDHKPVVEVKAPTPAAINNDTFELDPRMGAVASQGSSFAPFLAVARYPYKFAPPGYLQPLATAFWDAKKIYNRKWDLYYVSSSYCDTTQPVIFITEHQFQSLLDECNSAFPDAKLEIEDRHRESGLVLTFDATTPELRPHYLGHSDSLERYEFLVGEIPDAGPASVAFDANDRSLTAFKHTMELAQQAAKNKSKAKKERSKMEKDVQKRSAAEQVLLAERYLGLLPGKDDQDSLMPDITRLAISPLDITEPPSRTFENDVVFISIDLEAWELNHGIITEVGIATLDTRDLCGVAPGRVGEDWHKLIRGRHFRITEHKDKANHQFVQGCPDRFDFGESEMVSEDRVASLCTSCFHEPFSKRLPDGSLAPTAPSEGPPRTIVLVGHDIGQDIEYCKKIGFSPLQRGNLISTLDTATLYRSYSRDPNPRSLGSILYDFDLTGWNLHNAGNDAVYTIWALLALAVSDAARRDTDKKAEEDERKKAKPKPVFGPERPPKIPEGHTGLFTPGGVPLDV